MSAFHPESYEEALAHRQSKPPKIRKPLQARTRMKRSSLSCKKKKVKRAKKRKLTDGQLKKKVWKEFSIFIRTRGADENGFNKCVTCSNRSHWKLLHAGHFLRGRLNANLFDERGCHAQCYACNVGRDGNVVEYYEWMLVKYGPEVIAELKQQNGQTRKWLPGELAELLAHYKELNAGNPLVSQT
jgi:hypothetical protein